MKQQPFAQTPNTVFRSCARHGLSVFKCMIKRFLVLFLVGVPLLVNAQWRIGIIGGGDYNMYTNDEHYLTDFHNEGYWGATFGVAGQRDIKEWNWLHSKFSLQAEVHYIQKNYSSKKGYQNPSEFFFRNDYLQMPIIANYSLGSEKIRGFVNCGGFVGWKVYGINNEWHPKLDLGGVGGIGAEWNFWRLTLQAETRIYASALSATKSSRSIKTPHYNTTVAFQLALLYNLY